jgi:hypothetical protein
MFREQPASNWCNFQQLRARWNSLKEKASAIAEPRMGIKCRPPRTPHSGDISMTITAAHIPAIVALIAGILILIMPRLLNLVVAIYLICTGLIGLGLLKWLHM